MAIIIHPHCTFKRKRDVLDYIITITLIVIIVMSIGFGVYAHVY